MAEFGDSAVDRRKNRENSVSADTHYALAREMRDRIAATADRIASVERLVYEISGAHAGLRTWIMEMMLPIGNSMKSINIRQRRIEWLMAGVFVALALILIMLSAALSR